MTELKEKHQISRKGVMNLMPDKPYWWVAPAILFSALGIAAGAALICSLGDAMYLLAILVFIIIDIPTEIMFMSAKNGKRCEYEADDEKLIIRRPKKPEECYYYRDIVSVHVRSCYQLWFDSGYKVTIETKYRVIVRYFAFGGPHDKTPPQEIPFWILAENIPAEEPKKAESNGMITKDEYYENEKKKEP